MSNSGNWFFVADPHFGHANIIKYCNRPFLSKEDEPIADLVAKGIVPSKDFAVPFESVKRMDQTILSSINAVVQPDDHLVIVGDFCFAKGGKIKEATRRYRDLINCKNVYLILGNHDKRDAAQGVFTAVYENYTFTIDGHVIFASHYPSRSWDRAGYGSWCVYGHVHNRFHAEDNGQLMPYARQELTAGFNSVLSRHGIKDAQAITDELLAAVASLNGIDLTIDVGVDNVRPGLPFGTPWSVADLRQHMEKRQLLWEIRKSRYQKLK